MNKGNDKQLFANLVQIIEQGKKQVAVQVNSTVVLTYWQIGKTINEHILNRERAEYSKEIVLSVSTQLVEQFGKSFETKNLYRMMQFSEVFTNFEILVPLARQLSWSHFLVLLPLKNSKARLFYAQKAIEGSWGKRELRQQIERKAYERREIANLQIASSFTELSDTFKDPYFLDFLGLKGDNQTSWNVL